MAFQFKETFNEYIILFTYLQTLQWRNYVIFVAANKVSNSEGT